MTGPDGDEVPVNSRSGFANYRLLRLVGQAHADFAAEQAGTYTVAVDEAAPHADASIAVGGSVTGTLLRMLIGPAVVLLVGLIAAAAVVAAARR